MGTIPCKERWLAMDIGVGFVAWGGMEALMLSHGARGASILAVSFFDCHN
jgi:hypothetical protein